MEEQASNGTESLTMTVPTTLTASQISQIAQQVKPWWCHNIIFAERETNVLIGGPVHINALLLECLFSCISVEPYCWMTWIRLLYPSQLCCTSKSCEVISVNLLHIFAERDSHVLICEPVHINALLLECLFFFSRFSCLSVEPYCWIMTWIRWLYPSVMMHFKVISMNLRHMAEMKRLGFKM